MALPQPPGRMRGMTLAPPDHEAIAAEALEAMDGARQIVPFSARYPGLTLGDAYRILARLCELRTARGERVIGRKIELMRGDASNPQQGIAAVEKLARHRIGLIEPPQRCPFATTRTGI